MKLTTYNQKIDKFLSDTIKKCNKYDIDIICSLKSFVRENKKDLKSVGYFDLKTKKLAFCVKSTQALWLGALAHESSHVDQWIEDAPCWTEVLELETKSNIDTDKWITGTDYPLETVHKILDLTKQLEYDCEKRTVEKIKKYNLPINLKKYIKSANAYIIYHDFMKKNRVWTPGAFTQELLDKMPDNEIRNDIILTPEIEKEMD